MTFDLGVFAEYGREGDDTIAHVSTGERVIPPGVLGKDLSKKIDNKMEAMALILTDILSVVKRTQ